MNCKCRGYDTRIHEGYTRNAQILLLIAQNKFSYDHKAFLNYIICKTIKLVGSKIARLFGLIFADMIINASLLFTTCDLFLLH